MTLKAKGEDEAAHAKTTSVISCPNIESFTQARADNEGGLNGLLIYYGNKRIVNGSIIEEYKK